MKSSSLPRETDRQSRRSFLRRATLATGAGLVCPDVVTSSVLGADGQVAPSSRITVGYIGTGRQTYYANIPGFLREKDCQSIAVCDVDSWRMGEAKKKIEDFYAQRSDSGVYRGCKEYADWRELLSRPEIDVVMIGTQDHWHVVQSIAALNAGKDVACEKPLTRSIAEGRKLCEVVTQTGRVFRTDSEFRSNLTMFRAVELVRNGKLGKLERIITGYPADTTLEPQPEMPVPSELDYEMWQGPAVARPYTEKRVHPPKLLKARPGWLTIRDYADGMLANWGAHLNDIAMWGNNTEHTGPVKIEGTGVFPPSSNLWNVILEFDVRFTYLNGVELRCKSDRPYVRFEGSEGWVQVGYPKEIECSDETLLGWRPGPSDLHLSFKSSEKRDFLDAVKSRTRPLYDVEGGHRVNSLSHLALASIELDRSLKWDPEAEVAIGDEEANRFLAPKPLRAPWSLG